MFLGGGEPARLLAALSRVEGGRRVDTPVLAAIRELLHRGGLVAGTRSLLETSPSMLSSYSPTCPHSPVLV